MHERVLRLDQHDRRHVVERLGHVDPAVTAADDDDGRLGRGRLAHLNSCSWLLTPIRGGTSILYHRTSAVQLIGNPARLG
jgi:hypothetical protein